MSNALHSSSAAASEVRWDAIGKGGSLPSSDLRERIHEQVCQSLSAALMHLECTDMEPDSKQRIHGLILESVQELRDIAKACSPEQETPEDLHSSLVREVELLRLHGIPVRLYLHGEARGVLQELLTARVLRETFRQITMRSCTLDLSVRAILGKRSEVEVIERGFWLDGHPFQEKDIRIHGLRVKGERVSAQEWCLRVKY